MKESNVERIEKRKLIGMQGASLADFISIKDPRAVVKIRSSKALPQAVDAYVKHLWSEGPRPSVIWLKFAEPRSLR